MDFTEGNNSQILNKAAFIDGTPYVFADGSARNAVRRSEGTVNNKVKPSSSGYLLGLALAVRQNRTDIIQ